MKNCFLFDNDGTLVDSEHLCNVGLVIMFRRYGVELDADELVIRFRGWKLASLLTILEDENRLKLPDSFVKDYRIIVSELFDKELKPVEGIVEALEALDGPKAVVSSGPMNKIQQALSVCGLGKYFGCNLFSSYDVGVWKPDPGIYLHAAKEMGYLPKHCVVIDDGPVGVKAGFEAGMRTYFFNRFNEECEIEGVISFQSMVDLPRLVGT